MAKQQYNYKALWINGTLPTLIQQVRGKRAQDFLTNITTQV